MFSKDNSELEPSSTPEWSGQKSSMPSIISPDLTVHGDLICEGDLQIEGSIEGDVKSRNLTIGKAGSVKGAVEAEIIQVSGSIRGQIKAKTVTLQGAAQVSSDIWYKNLVIEAGALLNGMCKCIEQDNQYSQ